ncbi:hypothetical protein EOW77_0012045 [Bradyrhizobium yuanmingense]|uniref:hypothetical protein n=1 Tax=Bradyrhizobium yuanmingense TaxID=108015 RepID=UPI000FE3150E|nr:hypothetical protein [Bradyrhizobium yuanmingense]TGN88687.1 hypothetical protein EOW77_0012045 [Bradyrhizobium yuanmingense]
MPAASIAPKFIKKARRDPGPCVAYCSMSAVYAWRRLHLIASTLETCARAGIFRTHVLLPGCTTASRIALPSTLERHLLSQDGPRACDLPAARVDVAAAIGGAGAVERIKRAHEADAVVAIGFCERAGLPRMNAGRSRLREHHVRDFSVHDAVLRLRYPACEVAMTVAC